MGWHFDPSVASLTKPVATATSVMILLTIWLVLVLAVPNLSPFLAQTFRPTEDPKEVASAVASLVRDPDLRADLIRRGTERAATFGQTWAECADTVVRSLRSAMR